MKIEDVFKDAEEGKLTLEQFQEVTKKGNAKFVDLSEGGYVSQNKYNTDLTAKDGQIETLNKTIADRDTDLKTLQEQLAQAGNDSTKLSEVSTKLADLEAKYKDDTKAYEEQLSKQAREFAIKEHAATKKFTSAAAKRDYIEMMKNSDDVKLTKKGVLIGQDEFDTDYGKENEDAFLKEEPETQPEPENQGSNNLPIFAGPTQGEPFKDDSSNSSFGFSFLPQQTK